MTTRTTRRYVLQFAISALGGIAPGARRASAQTRQARDARIRLKPVRVSRELIQKTIVGLRPYRPEGYVVRSEKRGEQTIVHHYGHGGCGVTLSWGTAELAADEVARIDAKEIAILGCGAIGLATARILQQRGLRTTIYARDLPPNTLSDVAGARWYPFDVFDPKVASADFVAGLWKASRIAYATFRKMAGPEYGIFFRPSYVFQNKPLPKGSLLNFDSPIHDLLPGLRDLTEAESPIRSPVKRTFETMMIEPAIYLPAVMRDHEKAGGRIVVREFKTATDVSALNERVVVNCLGLGATAIVADAQLGSIKGQLTILKPQSGIDYVALPHGRYMFPRRDGIVLGGTFQRGVSTLDPDLAAEERIMADLARFFAMLRA